MDETPPKEISFAQPLEIMDEKWSEQTSAVFKSGAIIGELEKTYSTITPILNHNRSGVLSFIKAMGAMRIGSADHRFDVGKDGYINGAKDKLRFEIEVNAYVDKLFSINSTQFREQLDKVKATIAKFISDEYLKKLPKWPRIGGKNLSNIEFEMSSTNQCGSNHVVWSLVGMIMITELRPTNDLMEIEFSGSPDIKVAIIDIDKIIDLEKALNESSIDAVGQLIDAEGSGSNIIKWDQFQ